MWQQDFEQYFDQLPCYSTVQDRDFRIVAENKHFRDDFGPGVGGYCYEVYKNRSSKCAECTVEKTFADGKAHRSQELVRCRDGRELWVMVYTSPVYNAGEIVGALEISADITQVKRLQQRYQTLFDEVPCYISVQDRNLRILEANRRFKEDFANGPGGYCYEVYKHRREPCLVCPVATTFQDGETHRSEEVVTAKDGRKVNVLCYTAPVRDESGEIESVMEMSTNITEMRELQDQLTSLGMIVSSVSHGIKGLLGGLDGGVYLMETGFAKDRPDRTKNGLEMVKRNVDRIRSTVLNVLYYSKDRELNWEKVRPDSVIADVCETLDSRARQLNVAVVNQSDGHTGEFDGDPMAVHSLLVNLVENSLDACRTDTEKPEHEVRIGSRGDESGVVFEVADNGIGMDPETREKAFSLFFSSKGTEGTGLGLFIANKIATKHGGSIDIESEEGVGTTFRVRLPRHRAADES